MADRPHRPLRVRAQLRAFRRRQGAHRALRRRLVQVRSAGSEPGTGVNPVVAEVLAERGLSTAAEQPKKLDTATVQAADVVITMGCGETCPVFPGKRYEDWTVDDPAGQDIHTVRRIVDDVDARVRKLLENLHVIPVV